MMEAFELKTVVPLWDEMSFHPFFQETLVARPSTDSSAPRAVIMAVVPPVPPASPASPVSTTCVSSVASPRAIAKPRRGGHPFGGRPRTAPQPARLPPSYCHHGRARRNCVQCGGENTCEHGRIRDRCNACRIQGTGGRLVCPHGRYRTLCGTCGGSSYYQNKRTAKLAAALARFDSEA